MSALGRWTRWVRESTENGLYESVFDFAGRLDTSVLNKRQVENLIRAGAFDSLNPNRRQLFEAVETLVRHANAAQNDRESKQVNLFGVEDTAAVIPPLPEMDDWAVQERLQQEFESVGFYLSSHPLASYRKTCEKLGVVEWASVTSGRMSEGRIKLAGIVSSRRFHDFFARREDGVRANVGRQRFVRSDRLLRSAPR